MTKLTNSKCDKTQKLKMWQNLKTQNVTKLKILQNSITLNVTKNTGNYHVVAGAFRVEANSDKKVAQLQDEGFKARKIGKNRHGLHQVAYASYTSREDAFKALNSIRKEQNKDAWLLIKAID